VKVTSAQLLQAVTAAADQAAQVTSDGGPPLLRSDLVGLEGAFGQLYNELQALGAYVGATDMDQVRAPTASEL
jgi:hypothetical protein